MVNRVKRGSGWLRIFGFAAAMVLALGIAGCCADDGELCDGDSDCCSDYCAYDYDADDDICMPSY